MDDLNRCNIVSFKIIKDFVIEVHFQDGKVQIIDFGKLDLKGDWKELKNLEYFNKVKISEIDTLEWPNRQDFNPTHLYYWEEYEQYYLPKESK